MHIKVSYKIIVNICLLMSFFLICFSFGYSTLNRFDPATVSFLSDYSQISNIIQFGLFPENHENELIVRVFVPYLGHLIYESMPALGTWNMVSFSLLLVSSAFVSMTAVLIFNFSNYLFNNVHEAILASFLFITSFFTVNYTLITTVDSAYIFFLSCYLLALYSGKPLWCIPLMVLGCITKEAFLPIAASLSLGFIIYMFFIEKLKISIIVFHFFIVTIGVVALLLLDYLLTGSSIMPWQKLATISSINDTSNRDVFFDVAFGLVRVLLFSGPLLLLTGFGIRKLPTRLILPGVTATFVVIVLAAIVTVGAIDYVRFVFSATAPIIAIASSKGLSRLISNMPSSTKNSG